MNKLTNLLIPLLLVVTLNSSCAYVVAKPTPIDIPAKPVLAVCPAKPDITGKVSNDGKSVVISLPDAISLRNWMRDYPVCAEKNTIDQQGYIEKLINRLKAVGGN